MTKKFTIEYINGYYIVKDKSKNVVWADKSLEKCKKQIDSGMLEQAIELCRMYC